VVLVLDDAGKADAAKTVAERHPTSGCSIASWTGAAACGMVSSPGMAGGCDYYIWMNDETRFDNGLLDLLVRTKRERRERGLSSWLG
jgi:hypothetical protein